MLHVSWEYSFLSSIISYYFWLCVKSVCCISEQTVIILLITAGLFSPTACQSTSYSNCSRNLPYLYYTCIIKTFVIWRNIISDVTINTPWPKNVWLNKSHGMQHLCPLSQHLSLLLWKHQLLSVAMATRRAPRPPWRQSVFTTVDALTFTTPSFCWSQTLRLS